MGIVLLILGLLLFVGLVVIHEFGHFIAARRNGVEVEEFGIGFPPRAWKKRVKSEKGDYDFTLNWLPLGGFVKLKGENDDADAPGTFGAASLSAKVKIMVAGVIMNLLAAFVLFTGVAWIGMPQLPEIAIGEPQFTVVPDERVMSDVRNEDVVLIAEVIEGSPAEAAGISTEDELLSINGVEVDSPLVVRELTADRAGEEVSVVVQSGNDEPRELQVTLNTGEAAHESGYLGIMPFSGQEGFRSVRYTWSAPIVAVGTIGQFTNLTFQGLGSALTGFGQYLASFLTGDEVLRVEGSAQATEQVTGPVGIFYTLFAVSQEGIGILLFVIALISLALAIMNILPIPALDGGRLFVTLLFRMIRKPLHKSVEERIHATGFLLLMMLFVLITVVDVRRFF